MTDEDQDKLYGLLHNARERLCKAQMLIPDEVERKALDKAVAAIDFVGGQLPQWSRFDQFQPPPSAEAPT